MSNVTKGDVDGYFDDFDFDNAASIKHPLIAKLQADAKLLNEKTDGKVLDDDTYTWLSHQNAETKRHINEMIRHVMAMKLA